MTTAVGAAAAAFLPSTLPSLLRRPPLSSPAALFLNQLRFRSRIAAPPFSSTRRRGLRLPPPSASRRGQRGEEDEFYGDDSWPEEEEEEEDGDDDGDEAAIPFREMRRWFQNKPTGFGEGRSYDTSLEDELWEEMERSRRAQLASVNEVNSEDKKNENGGTKKKNKQQLLAKATGEDPCGPCVRIWNLPRKKNIHRDLQRAFKGFPGLVSISPAVNGNEKTREPICKGFAFLYFASEEAANKFVQAYSRRALTFGKVEKQIACDVVSPRGSSNCAKLPADDSEETGFKSQNVAKFSADDSKETGFKSQNVARLSADDSKETGFKSPNVAKLSADDPKETGFKSPNVAELSADDSEETGFKSQNVGLASHKASDVDVDVTSQDSQGRASDGEPISIRVIGESECLGSTKSVHPVQKQQKRTPSKKKAVKTYVVKTSKPSLPGSVARLKIKERTVMSGVFSKYSKNAAAES